MYSLLCARADATSSAVVAFYRLGKSTSCPRRDDHQCGHGFGTSASILCGQALLISGRLISSCFPGRLSRTLFSPSLLTRRRDTCPFYVHTLLTLLDLPHIEIAPDRRIHLRSERCRTVVPNVSLGGNIYPYIQRVLSLSAFSNSSSR